jgi:hypothetical protein
MSATSPRRISLPDPPFRPYTMFALQVPAGTSAMPLRLRSSITFASLKIEMMRGVVWNKTLPGHAGLEHRTQKWEPVLREEMRTPQSASDAKA